MKPLIVGVTGKAGSGKTTVCQILVRKFGFVELNFADPLKRMLLHGFPGVFTEDMLWGPSENKIKMVPYFYQDVRTILQRLGTDWARDQVNKDLWSSYCVSVAEDLLAGRGVYSKTKGFIPGISGQTVTGVVIGDLRFLNEAEAIRATGGCTIRVTRKGEGAVGLAQSAHQSETETDHIVANTIVKNDGTLSELEIRLSAALLLIRAVAR